MRKGRKGGSQAPRRRGCLAGLAYAARKLSPTARAQAAVLEHRSQNNVKLQMILIGYGARSTPGFAEETEHHRRSCMRGVKELEQAGLIRVGGPTREGKSYKGRRRWFQRVGGRLDGGKGRANEYWPGEKLGAATAARPRVAVPGPDGEEMTAEQKLASAENKRGLAKLFLESAEKLESEARAGP